MSSRIARVTGYSPQRDETYNPAIRDSAEAFRNYRREGRYRPILTTWLSFQ